MNVHSLRGLIASYICVLVQGPPCFTSMLPPKSIEELHNKNVFLMSLPFCLATAKRSILVLTHDDKQYDIKSTSGMCGHPGPKPSYSSSKTSTDHAPSVGL